MTDEKETHRRAFVSFYSAIFGPFPAAGNREEASIWWKFVDYVPEASFDELFTAVETERGKLRGKPHLGAFKRAWVLIRGRTSDYEPKDVCQLCDGTGLISVPCEQRTLDNGKRIYRFPFEETPYTILHEWTFPCKCTAGDFKARSLKIPQKVRERAFKLFLQIRKECGHQIEEERITLREFLEKKKDPSYTKSSPVWFAKRLVSESWRKSGKIDVINQAQEEMKKEAEEKIQITKEIDRIMRKVKTKEPTEIQDTDFQFGYNLTKEPF